MDAPYSDLCTAIASESGYVATPQGDSMFPLLRDGRDSVRIVPPPPAAVRGDVLLYVRADGTHVLHRVRAVTDHGYTMCGDGQTICEYGVPHSAVLGILHGVWRGSTYLPVTAKRYRIYVAVWCLSLRLRKFLLFFIKPRRAK